MASGLLLATVMVMMLFIGITIKAGIILMISRMNIFQVGCVLVNI